MILFKRKSDILSYLRKLKLQGHSIGLVPTMGALHEGHISLINESRRNCSVTVCSIFVNPTQFNDQGDLDKYPRTIEEDIRKLNAAGTDILFFPETGEMYGNLKSDYFELGELDRVYEGAFRPGHFAGVATIVKRLIEATVPDISFFGQKDLQQCLVIKKLIELSGLDTMIRICPTLREADGLAMSSRNRRLSEIERLEAAKIYKALTHIRDSRGRLSLGEALQQASEIVKTIPGQKTDYLDVIDPFTMKKAESWDDSENLAAIAAIFVGDTRLIDNLVVKGESLS